MQSIGLCWEGEVLGFRFSAGSDLVPLSTTKSSLPTQPVSQYNHCFRRRCRESTSSHEIRSRSRRKTLLRQRRQGVIRPKTDNRKLTTEKKGGEDSPPLSIPLRKSLFLFCSLFLCLLLGRFLFGSLLLGFLLCHAYRLLSLGDRAEVPEGVTAF